MADFSQFDEYKTTQEEIDKVLNFLKIFDPTNATPENAKDFLDFSEAYIHEAAHVSKDEEMEKLYKKFAAKKFNK